MRMKLLYWIADRLIRSTEDAVCLAIHISDKMDSEEQRQTAEYYLAVRESNLKTREFLQSQLKP